MNWMGGGKKRATDKKGSEIAKQRQYFGMHRANAAEASRQVPAHSFHTELQGQRQDAAMSQVYQRQQVPIQQRQTSVPHKKSIDLINLERLRTQQHDRRQGSQQSERKQVQPSAKFRVAQKLCGGVAPLSTVPNGAISARSATATSANSSSLSHTQEHVGNSVHDFSTYEIGGQTLRRNSDKEFLADTCADAAARTSSSFISQEQLTMFDISDKCWHDDSENVSPNIVKGCHTVTVEGVHGFVPLKEYYNIGLSNYSASSDVDIPQLFNYSSHIGPTLPFQEQPRFPDCPLNEGRRAKAEVSAFPPKENPFESPAAVGATMMSESQLFASPAIAISTSMLSSPPTPFSHAAGDAGGFQHQTWQPPIQAEHFSSLPQQQNSGNSTATSRLMSGIASVSLGHECVDAMYQFKRHETQEQAPFIDSNANQWAYALPTFSSHDIESMPADNMDPSDDVVVNSQSQLEMENANMGTQDLLRTYDQNGAARFHTHAPVLEYKGSPRNSPPVPHQLTLYTSQASAYSTASPSAKSTSCILSPVLERRACRLSTHALYSDKNSFVHIIDDETTHVEPLLRAKRPRSPCTVELIED